MLLESVEVFAAGMNAVEEKLHAAFYFYFLPSPKHFVSFGMVGLVNVYVFDNP